MVQTKEDFTNLVAEIKDQRAYREPIGFGICRVDRGQKNPKKILQASFPVANWKENYGSAAIFFDALQRSGIEVNTSGSEFVSDINLKFLEVALANFTPFVEEASGDKHKNIQVLLNLKKATEVNPFVEAISELTKIVTPDANNDDPIMMLKEKKLEDFKIVFIFEDQKPESVESVYLKLYALSQKKAELRSLVLDGAFGILENVAWVGNTPVELDWLRENEIELKINGDYPFVESVDKFPRFLQHVIPDDNTRILDSAKVRFGAQLAAGTTVMPGASYINFNAGTLGPVMVEGRISSSAIVGANSDVGGGASILGVLSGTDGIPITIGEACLLGANSVTGISLGNGCIIDAGLSILTGTKIIVTDEELDKIVTANPNWIPFDPEDENQDDDFDNFDPSDIFYIFKGEELSGLNGIHFRRDSMHGEVVALRSNREVKLNAELH